MIYRIDKEWNNRTKMLQVIVNAMNSIMGYIKNDRYYYLWCWVGKLVYDYLRIKGIGVSAFAVTKLQNDEMIDQTRVLALDDALRKYPNAYIILAVLPDKQKEMQNTLESKSIADYFILPEILLYEMRRVLLKYHAVILHVENICSFVR